MMSIRIPKLGLLACSCVILLAAGIGAATAQFLPSPVQSNAGGAFPPPPGQNSAPRQDPAFPPPPGQAAAPSQDSAFPPPPGAGGGLRPAVAGPGAAPPPGGFANPAQRVCMQFPDLRNDVQKAFSEIQEAGKRKVAREQACPMFKVAVAKEDKLLKFLETNKALCGVPPQIITQVKASHIQAIRIRDQICSNKPAPGSGPTLSDALGAPIIADDSDAGKPGRGTFDTLTGNVLAR